MINVEGDYKEIVRWLSDNRTMGVAYASVHGATTEEGFFLNYGLFSVCETHMERCHVCFGSDASFACYFSRKIVNIAGDEEDFDVEIEDAEHSHLIRF